MASGGAHHRHLVGNGGAAEGKQEGNRDTRKHGPFFLFLFFLVRFSFSEASHTWRTSNHGLLMRRRRKGLGGGRKRRRDDASVAKLIEPRVMQVTRALDSSFRTGRLSRWAGRICRDRRLDMLHDAHAYLTHTHVERGGALGGGRRMLAPSSFVCAYVLSGCVGA